MNLSLTLLLALQATTTAKQVLRGQQRDPTRLFRAAPSKDGVKSDVDETAGDVKSGDVDGNQSEPSGDGEPSGGGGGAESKLSAPGSNEGKLSSGAAGATTPARVNPNKCKARPTPAVGSASGAPAAADAFSSAAGGGFGSASSTTGASLPSVKSTAKSATTKSTTATGPASTAASATSTRATEGTTPTQQFQLRAKGQESNSNIFGPPSKSGDLPDKSNGSDKADGPEKEEHVGPYLILDKSDKEDDAAPPGKSDPPDKSDDAPNGAPGPSPEESDGSGEVDKAEKGKVSEGPNDGVGPPSGLSTEVVAEYAEICDEFGYLIEPNTYWPTVGPGDDGSAETETASLASGSPAPSPIADAAGDAADGGAESVGGDAVDVDSFRPTSSPVKTGFIFQSDETGDGDADDAVVDDGADTSTNSPGCSAFQSNQVYTTSLSAKVSFVYEISVDATTEAEDAVEKVDEYSARLVGGTLIQCESIRIRLLTDRTTRGRERRLRSIVDGIDPLPLDAPTDEPCVHFASDGSSACRSVRGEMTLYLRENSASSSRLQSSSQALKALMNEFNDENSPLLQDSGDPYSVQGLLGLRYISGTPDGETWIDNSGNGGKLNAGATGAASQQKNEETKSLSGLGISLVSLGSVAIIAMVLVATTKLRREENKGETYEEFYDEGRDFEKDWNDADADVTMETDSSDGSPRAGRMAYVYDEADESIYADCDATIIRELRESEEAAAARDIGDDRSLASKRPIFVAACDESAASGVEVRSIYTQYTQNRSVSKPTFDNPSGLGKRGDKGNRRVYVVGDTVEF